MQTLDAVYSTSSAIYNKKTKFLKKAYFRKSHKQQRL
ncbi:hypothetical protein T01_15246 [Trichinella spiralis]|uniref:Uncharacterized protein n=1 Tax=Trichinella spiralis TaxID=6334 RepID=A0A0V0YQ05_TRISP|nr:hypothetical protein T01_15246 [Trichinella spiralis]